jgi:hypothetical protein
MVYIDGLFKFILTFGNALAIAISFFYNQSIMWAIFHGVCGWFYVAYFAYMLQP